MMTTQSVNSGSGAAVLSSVGVSVRGKLVEVPCLECRGRRIVMDGKFPRMARIWDEEWLEGESVSDPGFFIQQLKSSPLRPDIFTFCQKFTRQGTRLPYYSEPDNVAAIPLTTYTAWWDALSQDTRRNVRRGEKRGLVVKLVEFNDEVVAGIKSVYDETPIRQGRQFWHYNKDFALVKRDNATYLDRSLFLLATHQDEVVGFIKMVIVDDVAQIMQILSKNAHFDKRPGNALIAKAVEVCTARGLKYLTYCRYTYGNKGDTQIGEFKRRNGFVQIDFPQYYVPLTLKGAAAMRIGLHRGLGGMLPGWLIKALLAARAKAYAWRQPAQKASGAAE